MGRFYNWYRRMFPVIDYRVAARDDLAQAKFDLLYTQAEIEDQECELMKLQKRIARLEQVK